MSLLLELVEDSKYFYESLSDNPKREFKFNGSNGPIIALHGVTGGWVKNGPRKYMEINNVEGVLNYFGSMEDGLDNYVEQTKLLVDEYPNSLILGFSAGGIIALKYAEKYGYKNFKRLITIASPLFGSPPAKFVKSWGETYSQLSPKSSYLDKVSSINPPKNKVLSIFSEYDIKAPFNNVTTLNWPVMIVDSNSHGQIHSDYKILEKYINKEIM